MPLADAEIDPKADARWQLIERITQTEPFQKSTRLPALLRYLAECSISGHRDGLTEQRIGQEVFGKPAGYTPAEDSSVRVHVRQLRLRLHEYFDSEGRHETLTAEIPKGAYTLVFHNSLEEQATRTEPSLASSIQEPRRRISPIGWLVQVVVLSCIALFCAFGWYRAASRDGQPPWPLNTVIQDHAQTTVVVADSTFILRMLGDKEVSLDDYADRGYLKTVIPSEMEKNEARLVHYLGVSQLTSIADVLISTNLVKLAGVDRDNLVFRSARDVNPRNLDHGNYIFIGAKTSNPWVSLFEDRLNFEFVEDSPGGRRYIRNKKPQSGEQEIYEVPDNTGSSGSDYATISLLPNRNGQGTVLILQGLRLEGTEAAGMLLAGSDTRAKLRRALGLGSESSSPVYFEALLHTQSVVGSPGLVDIVATRIIKP